MRTHNGGGKVSDYLSEFRKGIFQELSFSFVDFCSDEDKKEEPERTHISKLIESLSELVTQMGGTVARGKSVSNIWVFYKDDFHARNI